MENLIEAVKELKAKRQTMLGELQARYNKLLIQQKKLKAYIDDNSISVEKREAKIAEFKEILRRLNQLLMEISRLGHKPESGEILNGFK